MIIKNYRIPYEGRSRYKDSNNIYTYREVIRQVNRIGSTSTAAMQSLAKTTSSVKALATGLDTVTTNLEAVVADTEALKESLPLEPALEPELEPSA